MNYLNYPLLTSLPGSYISKSANVTIIDYYDIITDFLRDSFCWLFVAVNSMQSLLAVLC